MQIKAWVAGWQNFCQDHMRKADRGLQCAHAKGRHELTTPTAQNLLGVNLTQAVIPLIVLTLVLQRLHSALKPRYFQPEFLQLK